MSIKKADEQSAFVILFHYLQKTAYAFIAHLLCHLSRAASDVFQRGGVLVVINGQDGGADDEPAVPENDFVKQRMLLVGLPQ